MSNYSVIEEYYISNDRKSCFNYVIDYLLNLIKLNAFLKIKSKRKYSNILGKVIKSIFILASFVSIYFFYYLSLETCNEGTDKCSLKSKWIKLKLKEEIISCVLLELMIQLMLYDYLSKKHIIHVIIIFSYFYYISHGFFFHDHGYFNFFYYFILLAIITVVIMPFDCIFLYCRLKKFVFKLSTIYLLIILFLIIFFGTIDKNCNDWPKGLNNTYIQNDKSKYGCQIQFPKTCIYKTLEYFQDYSRTTGKDCKNLNGKKLKENIWINHV